MQWCTGQYELQRHLQNLCQLQLNSRPIRTAKSAAIANHFLLVTKLISSYFELKVYLLSTIIVTKSLAIIAHPVSVFIMSSQVMFRCIEHNLYNVSRNESIAVQYL